MKLGPNLASTSDVPYLAYRACSFMIDFPPDSMNPYEAPKAAIALPDSWDENPLAPNIASLGWRFVAFAADYLLLLGIIYGLLSVPMVIAGYGPAVPFGVNSPGKALGVGVVRSLVLLGWTLYFAIQESSRWQSTLGKRLFRLRVVRIDGKRVSFGRSIIRALMKLIGLIVLCLGVVPAIFNRRRQTLHDAICGTVVIRDRVQKSFEDEGL